MGVEFFSDFIKSIQPLQTQMAITLHQEFKHQAQLNTVRAPQNRKTKAHLENRGKGKKRFEINLVVPSFQLHFLDVLMVQKAITS